MEQQTLKNYPDSDSHGSLDPETNANPIITNYDAIQINYFKPIDQMDQASPKHLYPNFKIFPDNFKSNHQTPYQQ